MPMNSMGIMLSNEKQPGGAKLGGAPTFQLVSVAQEVLKWQSVSAYL
jgi:hypothetical protein